MVSQSMPAQTPSSHCLLDMIAAQRAQSPEADALRCGGETIWSYDALWARSETIAAALLAKDIKPGNIVGLLVNRTPDMIAAMLGVLRAGAVYLPLDPSYPSSRLHYMIEDSEAALVLTDHAPDPAIIGASASMDLHDISADSLSSSAPLPVMETSAATLQYLLYTSGSTGRPKGVAVTRGNVANFLQSMAETPGMTANQRLLAVTTMSFDISGLEFFLPLVVGGTVILATEEDVIDGHKLLGLIDRHEIDIMQSTPTTWRMLLEAGWQGGAHFKALCGGEAMPTDLAVQLATCCGEAWNMYGPTETTIWSSCHRLPEGGTPVLLGKPIAKTSIYILDTSMRLLPTGVPGEIYIGGDGVAAGYWRRDELTAERFLPDPFSDQPDARMYRTGDRGRYRNDGSLEYRGRLDAQIKIRGYRIELGEIEAALAAHPKIDVATAKIVGTGQIDAKLVAYIVSDPALNDSDLRQYLADSLPPYMIPYPIIRLDTLPLTPNGKIDRNQLPDPDLTVSREDSFLAPETATEIAVAKAFSTILNIDQIGADANFFALGGHSILAMRLLSRLRQTVSPTIELKTIFDVENVRELAGLVDQSSDSATQAREEFEF